MRSGYASFVPVVQAADLQERDHAAFFWRRGAPEHRQLLSEREVLKGNGSVSTAEQREGSEQDDKRSQHERSCRAIVQESTGVLGDLVLAKDNFRDVLKLNPNDPKYGSWWDALEHLQNSWEINQKWAQWIEAHPDATADQALQFARQLAADYGLKTLF